jgi:hypothetical protein
LSNDQSILKSYKPISYLLFIKRCFLEPHKFFTESSGQKILSQLGIKCPAVSEGGFELTKQGVSIYLVMDYLHGYTLQSLCLTSPAKAKALQPKIINDIKTMIDNNVLNTDINLENIYY